MPETVRAITDSLVSLSLFGAFTVETREASADFLNPWVFAGLPLGAIMPYALAA